MESQSLECLTHRNATTKSSELPSILTFENRYQNRLTA